MSKTVYTADVDSRENFFYNHGKAFEDLKTARNIQDLLGQVKKSIFSQQTGKQNFEQGTD